MLKNKIGRSLVLIFFGVLTFLILAELTLRLAGYIYVSNQDRLNKKSLQKNPNYTILALGESTTEMGGEDSWPKQLEKILNEKVPNVKFSVINKGRSGTNSHIILSELEENLNKYQPDMVITMMGINDGITPDLQVQDKAFATNIEKASNEDSGPSLIKQLKIYKLLKLLKVLIDRQLGVQAQENSDDKLHVELGNQYISQNRNEDAGKEYQKALEINGNSYEAIVGLGNYYKNNSENEEAEQMYRKAIAVDPQKTFGFIKLGIHLRDLERYEESIQAFRKVIELDPSNENGYHELSIAYRYAGKFKEAEETIKSFLKINSNSKYVYQDLENLYRQMGDYDKVNQVYSQVLGINTEAVNNYRKLKEIVLARNIKLVAMQYPVRKVKTLKNLIGTDNVIFVDNEKNFKDALKEGKYDDYFIDKLGGDFGHATSKGNYLIASNVANVIIEEIFKKQLNISN